MGKCERCGDQMRTSTMSKFNTQTICIPCASEERQAPGFEHAEAMEDAAVRRGDYNFKGVGLSEDDIAFVVLRIAARSAHRAATKPCEWSDGRCIHCGEPYVYRPEFAKPCPKRLEEGVQS